MCADARGIVDLVWYMLAAGNLVERLSHHYSHYRLVAPFHCVGVDVLQLPLTEAGNHYVLVFLNYFTKWVEAFAVPDQCTETITQLLVEEIFCRHGAPAYLPSDRGTNLLSE